MHKFYWNNTHTRAYTGSASANGSGNGASTAGGSSSGVKIADNQLQTQQLQSSSDFPGVNNTQSMQQQQHLKHPEVPMRANGGTATIRVEQRSQRATTPSGSHRVLLKLKKMSSANRPKSMHEANQNSSESAKNQTSSSSTDQLESNDRVPQSEKVKKKSSQLPTSKSMHGFYNRTWNERSLSKYANEHNYENVYNNQHCPNYENVYNNGGSHRGHGGCHFEAGNSADSCEGCVISQLTCSPRSARTRITHYDISQPQPEYHVPPVPPERKGRGRKRGQLPMQNNKKNQEQPPQPPHLFRSKSCERPKMRDTFRMDKFAANFNRISSNITDKLLSSTSHISSSSNKPEYHNHHNSSKDSHNTSEDSCREIDPVSPNNSLLQSVAFRAIPCVDIQTTSSASSAGHYYSRPPPTHNVEDDDDLDNISDLSVPLRPPTASSNASSTSRPSLALSHKMKGFRKDMQQKISRLRSRSAERISKRLQNRSSDRHDVSISSRSTSIDDGEDEVEDDDSDEIMVATIHQNYQSHNRMTKSFSGLPSISTPSNNEVIYNGPFIGRARALVDYTPSPYDRDALRFNRGDTIDIIAMNPSGLWRGRCQGRIGHFKFINVELLPDRHVFRSSEQRQKSVTSQRMQNSQDGPPKTVEDLLKRISLEEHLSVFVLNGYEELENFHDLDETELDYLGITEPAQRAKILTAVELMQDNSTTSATSLTAADNNNDTDDTDTEKNASPILEDDHDEIQDKKSGFERHKFPRDSGCFASSSSPASDRSSQPSQSESGISGFSGIQPDEDDYSDENSTNSAKSNQVRRPAEKSAQTRNLRDRHGSTLNTVNDLEKLSINVQHVYALPAHSTETHSVNNSGLQSQNSKDNFEVLVEKYVTEKTPLQVTPGRVSTTRSIFETTTSATGGGTCN